MDQNILLLSIRHHYAVKLFAGTKKVELRRIKPKLNPGDIVVVYVSSPVKAVAGFFVVQEIIQSVPTELWDQVKDLAGISKYEFEKYYDNSRCAWGIVLKKFKYFEPPLALEYLRLNWKNFSPPQSYKYLKYHDWEYISQMAEQYRG